MIIENSKDYYGFLNGYDIIDAAKLTEELRKPSLENINDVTIASDVVEEVIRRDGDFFTGTEAKPIAPWDIKYTNVYFARYKFYDDEPRPVNPAYHTYDWIPLLVAQYMYGKYLTDKVNYYDL